MSEENWKKIKRLIMQSNRRGMKENDLILGGFVKNYINNLSEKNLNDYESLLLENDQDLYLWFSGAIKPPKHFEIIVKIISDTLR